jgi:hypothetical protein
MFKFPGLFGCLDIPSFVLLLEYFQQLYVRLFDTSFRNVSDFVCLNISDIVISEIWLSVYIKLLVDLLSNTE